MARQKKRTMHIIIGLAALIVSALAAVLVVLPPGGGRLPPCKVPGGLSERTFVEAEGGKLSLVLLSQNTDNPVLMVCGGGPGIPQYLLEYLYPSALPEEFTVCYWNYRGTGPAYSKADKAEDMTTAQYMKDAAAVTDYLRKRFSCEKIYIMGHSFGTYIALKTVQAFPEKYKAYIAMSQIVNSRKSELLAFNYMKNQYEKAGNSKMVKQFEKYDMHNSENDYASYCKSGLRDKAMHELGIGTTRNMRSVITGIFFPSLKCKAFTQKERINLWKGKFASANYPVNKDAHAFDAERSVSEIEIPIYFIIGEHDFTCCASLQKEYFSLIKTPQKRMYLFENSAHSPLYEEHDKARHALLEIKTLTNSAAD